MSEASVPPSAAAATTTPKLFVRQSSGLVRNVSVTNALFFNVAAFVGVGLTLYPIFYSLPFVPMWKAGPFSAYGWASTRWSAWAASSSASRVTPARPPACSTPWAVARTWS